MLRWAVRTIYTHIVNVENLKFIDIWFIIKRCLVDFSEFSCLWLLKERNNFKPFSVLIAVIFHWGFLLIVPKILSVRFKEWIDTSGKFFSFHFTKKIARYFNVTALTCFYKGTSVGTFHNKVRNIQAPVWQQATLTLHWLHSNHQFISVFGINFTPKVYWTVLDDFDCWLMLT